MTFRYLPVGLAIQGRCVIVDHSCQDWLLTEAKGNPTIENIGGLKIYSVFRRLRLSRKMQRDRQRRQIGDNCPLIYALKLKEGLTTDITSIVKLSKSFVEITGTIARLEPAGYQLVISMPSAHRISYAVGKRFARRFKTPHVFSAFRKELLMRHSG